MIAGYASNALKPMGCSGLSNAENPDLAYKLWVSFFPVPIFLVPVAL